MPLAWWLLGRMPAGLRQLVGEFGWQLSHGERSRLHVARALLQHPDVFLLATRASAARRSRGPQPVARVCAGAGSTLALAAHP